MGLLVRTLLIWLLVLAVPAQGAAAATMAFCGPNHHGSSSARVEVSAATSKHSHHGGAESVHEVRSGASTTMAAADDVPTVMKVNQASKQKCSVCASCCSMGAILTAADGPDRPPRNVLA